MNTYRDLALSRLTWPSGLVRERAATAVARLIAEGGDEAAEGYLHWLTSQRLESTTVIGFLVLVRMLQMGHLERLPSLDAVRAAQGRPSILSGFLCRTVYGDDCGAPRQYFLHSGSAPEGWSLPEFFEKHVASLVPPIHLKHADHVESAYDCPFRKQWAFEWQRLVDELDAPMTISPLWRLMDGAGEGRYRPIVVDTWMSEIYRSSYLRALQWVVAEGKVPFGNALAFAGELCPVGLLLWRCEPNAKPTWWPSVAPDSDRALDVAPAAFFETVEDLWNRQGKRQQWDEGTDLGNSFVLGAARGLVAESNVTYYLEIVGVLQRAVGPDEPPVEVLGSWIFGDGVFRGAGPVIRPLEDQARIELGELEFESLGDWEVAPVVAVRNYGSRWQYWRMEGLCLPAEGLASEVLDLEVGDQSVIHRSPSGHVYGRWWDWTDGIREKVVDNVPPRSGQVLSLDAALIEQVQDATQSTFCWMCRLTMFDQAQAYEAHRETRVYRFLGGSYVIRPSSSTVPSR